MRALAAAIGLIHVLAGPGLAQNDATRLAKLMSEQYAKQAVTALRKGDREAAIGYALRGLPAEPTEEDLAVYHDAMFALELAHGARVPRIDQDRSARFSVNSDGTRAFISHWEDSSRPDAGDFPQAIIDPRDSTLIRELEPQIEVQGITSPAISASFSPDGAILALPSNKTSSVHLYAAEDGTYLGEMKPGAEAASGSGSGYEVGFSSDGRLYARGYLVGRSAGIHIWDVASRELLHHLPMESRTNARQWPIGWNDSGGLFVQTTLKDQDPGQNDQVTIEKWTLDGRKSDFHSTERPPHDSGIGPFPFPSAGLLLLSVTEGLVALDMATGQVRFSTKASAPFVASARGGQAFVIKPRQLIPPDEFIVVDLQGNELEITGKDAIPFMHDVFSLRGNRITEATGMLATTYTGDGIPSGIELYEEVWGAIDASEKSAIDAERVLKP